MSTSFRQVLIIVTAVVMAFAAGHVSGLFLARTGFESPALDDDHDPDHVDDADDEDAEEPHIALTRQACGNLGLKMGTPDVRDFWVAQTIPGEVVEIPGQSSISISAPVTGVVESVFVRPGQAAAVDETLFRLRITDEELNVAQADYIAGVARAEILKGEIERLAPLTASGAVVGRRKRELEFELIQKQSAQAVLKQEMRTLGFSDDVIRHITETRNLESQLLIKVPQRTARATEDENSYSYTTGTIFVQPGQSVARGEPLCKLDDHRELYIRGEAFEGDLHLLDQLTKRGWGITAEFGHLHGEQISRSDSLVTRTNLPLVRIDNSVDPKTQTFRFFLPLRNEIAQSLSDSAGRSFHQWRFKPGQRVQLKIPTEHWTQQFVLPADAVAMEGPNSLVFVPHTDAAALEASARKIPATLPMSEKSRSTDDPASKKTGYDVATKVSELTQFDAGNIATSQSTAGSYDTVLELQPLPVRVLHRDDRFAVIADDGQLSSGEIVALNAAFELYQAFKQRESSGGGHHHHH